MSDIKRRILSGFYCDRLKVKQKHVEPEKPEEPTMPTTVVCYPKATPIEQRGNYYQHNTWDNWVKAYEATS